MALPKHRSKARVLVVGSCSIDMIVQVDRIPIIGETVIGGRFNSAGGGKGANQAVTAARAGASVEFVGRVGRDDFGKNIISGLKADGINVSRIEVDPREPSGIAFIFVGGAGENSIAVASGANLRLSPRDVAGARGSFSKGTILLVQLETPLSVVGAAVSLARRRGMHVILNPAPARSLPDALLRKVDIITPNEHEAESLTGIKVDGAAAAQAAAKRLHGKGVGTVIITLGSRGAYVSTGAGGSLMPAFKAKAVDTTAAGDVFNGALAVALAEGQPLPDAVRFGQAAASISVTRLGAQPSAPTRAEIDRLLARNA